VDKACGWQEVSRILLKSNKIQQKKFRYGTIIKTPYPTVLVGFMGLFC
jgi:hypothetical protein